MQYLPITIPGPAGTKVNLVASGEVIQVLKCSGHLIAHDDHGNSVGLLNRGSWKLDPFGKLDIESSVPDDQVELNIGRASEWGLLTPEEVTDWEVVNAGPILNSGITTVVFPPGGKSFRLKGFRIDISQLANLGAPEADTTIFMAYGVTLFGPRFVVTLPAAKPAITETRPQVLEYMWPGNSYFTCPAPGQGLGIYLGSVLNDGGVCVSALVDYV